MDAARARPVRRALALWGAATARARVMGWSSARARALVRRCGGLRGGGLVGEHALEARMQRIEGLAVRTGRHQRGGDGGRIGFSNALFLPQAPCQIRTERSLGSTAAC